MFPYTNSSSTTTSLEGPFLHFPSPFLDDVDDGLMSHLLSQHHHNNPPPEERNGLGGAYKKRVKRDRHTKICTAQGLRDRRMRLSVKVARKFFDLQDMLDFDKASKTIDWLLINSASAIQELAARTSQFGCGHNQFSMSSSASVSEVTETNKETGVMEVITSTKPQEMRKRRRTCYHKVVNVNPFAKESRDNARARARERTREKMTKRSQSQNNESYQLKTSKKQDSGNFVSQGNRYPDEKTEVNGANLNHEFQGHTANYEGRNEPEADLYAMTGKKTSLGNVQVQNTIPNDQEHSCTLQPSNSVFMTNSSNGGQYWNPSSIFGTTPINGQYQQNPIPNSIFMNPNALEIGMITSPLFTPTSSNNIALFHSHFHGNHFL